jgi:hypothetical protein
MPPRVFATGTILMPLTLLLLVQVLLLPSSAFALSPSAMAGRSLLSSGVETSRRCRAGRAIRSTRVSLSLASSPKSDDSSADQLVSFADASDTIRNDKDDDENVVGGRPAAATNTINERLLAELQEAEQKERFGARSAAGKKFSLVDGFGRRRKTDDEIRAAIAEARDLNGVNPLVAIGGSFFAFAVAAVLWISTNKLGVFFATHPPETDVYFVVRSAQVFRNVMMGLISLASGFFGVTGLGIFLLGVRVAYGVAVGELDPTPIKKSGGLSPKDDDGVDLSNVWDLMMNKKPGRKGGGGRT